MADKTSCKNQKFLLGLGFGRELSRTESVASSQESGELRMNNNQLNGLFIDFMPFNPYFCRF